MGRVGRLPDQSKAAVDSDGAIAECRLVFRRVVPGEGSIAIRETDDGAVGEGRLAGQNMPGATGDKLATELFEDGAGGGGLSILGFGILDGQLDYDMGTHFGSPVFGWIGSGSEAGPLGDARIPARCRGICLGDWQIQRLGREVDCDDGGDVGDTEPLTGDESSFLQASF